jgi:hypothetical protein
VKSDLNALQKFLGISQPTKCGAGSASAYVPCRTTPSTQAIAARRLK